MKSSRTIFLDMDEVLVSLHGPILGLFGVPESYVSDISDWDAIPLVVSDNIGREVTDAELWGRVSDAGESFWSGLPWTPWGREILSSCQASCSRVVILTHPKDAASYAGKMAWLDRELPAFNRATADDKSVFAMGSRTLLVDDADHNVRAFREAGGCAVTVPRPWNACRLQAGRVAAGAVDRIERWASWENARGF